MLKRTPDWFNYRRQPFRHPRNIFCVRWGSTLDFSFISGEIDGACAWVTTYSTLVGEFRAESVLLGAIGPIGAVQTCSKCFQSRKRVDKDDRFCAWRVLPCQSLSASKFCAPSFLIILGVCETFFARNHETRFFSRYLYIFTIKFADARRVEEIFKSRVIINTRNTGNLTLPRWYDCESKSFRKIPSRIDFAFDSSANLMTAGAGRLLRK